MLVRLGLMSFMSLLVATAAQAADLNSFFALSEGTWSGSGSQIEYIRPGQTEELKFKAHDNIQVGENQVVWIQNFDRDDQTTAQHDQVFAWNENDELWIGETNPTSQVDIELLTENELVFTMIGSGPPPYVNKILYRVSIFKFSPYELSYTKQTFKAGELLEEISYVIAR